MSGTQAACQAWLQTLAPLANYLEPTSWVDCEHPEIRAHLAACPRRGRSEEAVIQETFEFVRDQVVHSWDIISCSREDRCGMRRSFKPVMIMGSPWLFLTQGCFTTEQEHSK